MNLKKIIKESLENDSDWEWANVNPTLNDYFNHGLINKGDTLWLKGYTKINTWDPDTEKIYLDGWFKIIYVGDDLTRVKFMTSEEIIEMLALSIQTPNFIEPDGDLEVYKVEKESLTEAKKKDSDFDWIIESDPYVRLEPNTLYYFEPNIGDDEMVEFTNRFAPGYKYIAKWLRGLRDRTVKYFVTDETGKDTTGWCNMTPIDEALEFYEEGTVNVINAREYFGI